MSPRTAGLLVSLFAVLATAAPALAARPPAQGAPGARHTWAPADKHGFGTAHQLAGHAYFTLRQASLSEVYYPDLSHAGVPRAAVRGHRRQDVRGPRGRRRRPAPHRARRARRDARPSTPLDRSLGVPPGDRERPLAADQDLDHRPRARQRARARALRGQDPDRAAPVRARRPGARQRRQRRPRDLAASRRWSPTTTPPRAPSPPRPRSRQTSSGYRGTASDPWRDLQDYKLDRTDATQPGNVVQGARAALDGKDNQTMTLAIGFGRDASAATAAATGSLASGFDAAKAAYDSGWSAYLASLKAPPAPVAGDAQMRRLYEQSLLVLAGLGGQDATAAPRSPRRTCRGSGARSRSPTTTRPPTRTTWSGRATSTTPPPRRRRPATTPPRTGSSTTCGASRRRPRPARSGRTPASTARRSGRASSSTRPRCRSCSPGGWAAPAPPTGTTSAPPPTT